MTYREIYEDVLKTPAISTVEWFQCIPSWQMAEARRLVLAKVPVCVQPQPSAGSPAFLVMFEDTEFLAGGFDEKSAADAFAGAWNSRLDR